MSKKSYMARSSQSLQVSSSSVAATEPSSNSENDSSSSSSTTSNSGYRLYRPKKLNLVFCFVILSSYSHNAHTQAGYTGTLPSHPYQIIIIILTAITASNYRTLILL